AGPGHDVGLAVAGHVAGGDEHAAREARGVGVEALEQAAVPAAEDLDVRPAPRTGPGDDVVHTVAVDVAGGHADAAGEDRVVGVEAEPQRPVGVDDQDLRPAAGVRPGGEQRAA